MNLPNINYINQLARGDESVKETLINVVKTEFPEEKKEYFETLKSKEFKKIEVIVHRIKHKFSILGLETSYKNADKFELNLRNHILIDKDLQDFEDTLKAITEYLKTI